MSGSNDIFRDAYVQINKNIEQVERIKKENTDFIGRKHYEEKREFIKEMKTMIYNTYIVMKTISNEHLKENSGIFKQDFRIESDIYIHHDIHSTIYTLFKYFPENFNKILQSVIIDFYRMEKPKIDFYNVMLVYLLFFLESFPTEHKLFYMEFVCNTFGSAAFFAPDVKFKLYHLYSIKHNIIKEELEKAGYKTTKLDCMIPFNNTLDSTSISEEEAVQLGAPPEPEDKRTKRQKVDAEEQSYERDIEMRKHMPSRKIPDSYVQMRLHDREQVNREIIEVLGNLPIETGFFDIQQPRGGRPKQRRKTRRIKKKSKKTKKRTTKYK